MPSIDILTERLARSSIRLTTGGDLAFVTAGDPRRPALLLIHGFPSSADTFRTIIPTLAEVAYVAAPDLPAYGESDVLPETTFNNYAAVVGELLDRLDVGERFVCLHDYGAPVGLRIAMQRPELVRGLIIQNANAHSTGQGPGRDDTRAFWAHPTTDNEAKATAHLTFEGVRDQYVAGVPEAVARFDAISDYLRTSQPPALMVWGRHDIFFDLAETVSWMEDLPRMEAHILDGGHFLLETHGPTAAVLMTDFVTRVCAK